MFVKAAEVSSFSKAAIDLGVTPQAVSMQIKYLEEAVRVRLFHRNTRKIKLTEEGFSFYEYCRSGVTSIEDGIRSLRDSEEAVAGLVRVAVPYFMSRTYILPLLKTYLEKNKNVSVEVITQHGYPDLVDQGVDIAFLSRHQPRNSFIARKICSMHLVLCASPDYLRKYGVPQTHEDLQNYRCVLLRHPHDGKIMPWEFQRGKNQVTTLNTLSGLTTNDIDTQRQAVLDGIGIGQLASFYASSLLRSGRLIPINIGYIADPIPLYLCTARSIRTTKRIRVLVDLLYRGLKQHPDFNS